MIKVLIADDIRILRQGLEAILSQDSGIEVVATASDGEEAYIMCQLYKPDVVLMDMRMPEFDGEYVLENFLVHFLTNRISKPCSPNISYYE